MIKILLSLFALITAFSMYSATNILFVLARMMQGSFSYQAARLLGNPGSLLNFSYLKFSFAESGDVCMWQVQFGSRVF